jgi:transketolase
MILCNTIKGKGVSFMENSIKWHHSLPNHDEIEKARKELK